MGLAIACISCNGSGGRCDPVQQRQADSSRRHQACHKNRCGLEGVIYGDKKGPFNRLGL